MPAVSCGWGNRRQSESRSDTQLSSLWPRRAHWGVPKRAAGPNSISNSCTTCTPRRAGARCVRLPSQPCSNALHAMPACPTQQSQTGGAAPRSQQALLLLVRARARAPRRGLFIIRLSGARLVCVKCDLPGIRMQLKQRPAPQHHAPPWPFAPWQRAGAPCARCGTCMHAGAPATPAGASIAHRCPACGRAALPAAARRPPVRGRRRRRCGGP